MRKVVGRCVWGVGKVSQENLSRLNCGERERGAIDTDLWNREWEWDRVS